MVRRFLRLSVLGIVLLATSGVRAATLTNATWFQVVQGIPLTRTFGQLGAAGSSTSTSIAVNLSYPFFATTRIFPKTANGVLDFAVQVTQGGAQSITATANMAAGSPGVSGTVVVMTAAHVAMGANQSKFMVGTNTIVAVPISAGNAALLTGTFIVLGALHTITVQFYAWTPGTLTFSGLTTKGLALPNVVAMGSFNLFDVPCEGGCGTSGEGWGHVTLVSPSRVSIDGSVAQRRTASFTKLVLSFVPEPGTLLLLGGSALAFVLRQRRARR